MHGTMQGSTPLNPTANVHVCRRRQKRFQAKGNALLFDLHCHIDFARNPEALAHGARQEGIAALSATVAPGGYEPLLALLAPYDHLCAGLGLHPWWIADGRCDERDVALFCEKAHDAPIIGEIGLDFSGERAGAGAREAQTAAFERVVDACMHAGSRKVITLHSANAATAVLDVLERAGALERHTCIFHWFSGTSDELARARRAGCYFSLGERMLKTRRGQAYARAIEQSRLLLETDAPPREGAAFSAVEWKSQLVRTLDALARARGESAAELSAAIAHTSEMLLFRETK